MTGINQPRVFLIINEKIINQILEEFLRNLNYEVCGLGSISELINILRIEQLSRVMVIIEENAFTGKEKVFVRKIIKQFKQLFFIVITNNRPGLSIKEAISNRIYGFLHKPNSLLELELFLTRLNG